jgi:citrate lyase subunit beta / citryl-CoA lyase
VVQAGVSSGTLARRLCRNPLFVPAHQERLRTKAVGLACDATVLDLEDAVPPDAKQAARDGAAGYVGARPGHAFVRINPLVSRARFTIPCGAEDIAAVVRPGLRGIVFPKVETAEDLHGFISAVSAAEGRAGLDDKSIELWAILETARGVVDAAALARLPLGRSVRFCFGAGDYTRDIGVEWTRGEQECFTARSIVVMAARASGLPGPIDSVYIDVGDDPGLRESAELAKRLGFRGKFCIHPRQLEIVERVFTPTDAEVTWSRRVIAGLEAAERAGAGAFVVDGRMIHYPIIERAREVVALHAEIGAEATQ